MHRQIICDENIPKRFVHLLTKKQYQITRIANTLPGSMDTALLRTLDKNSIFITSDRDFGELIFFRGIFSPHATIIYCRTQLEDCVSLIFDILQKITTENIQSSYITISRSKIRRRKI